MNSQYAPTSRLHILCFELLHSIPIIIQLEIEENWYFIIFACVNTHTHTLTRNIYYVAALWLLPDKWLYGDWPASGEIDMTENIGMSHDSCFKRFSGHCAAKADFLHAIYSKVSVINGTIRTCNTALLHRAFCHKASCHRTLLYRAQCHRTLFHIAQCRRCLFYRVLF